MSKKLGLALGGGGARGVAHAGFLKALEEEGIKPYCIAGTSMGAVVGGCYVSGISADEMREVFYGLKTLDLLDIEVKPYTRLSLLRSKKVQRLFLQYIGDKNFEDAEIPFCCTAVDLYSGKLITLNSGSIAGAVQASACVPAVFRPVKMDDKMLVDGGVLCRVPVKQCKQMGADVVLGVDVIKNSAYPVTEVKNLVRVLTRVFEIVDTVNVTNERKEAGYPCDLLIEPEIEGVSQFSVKKLDAAYDDGYRVCKQHMPEIKRLLLS